MEKIRLITDSASDISYEDEKMYDIRVLPFEVVLGEKSYVSRVDFDNEGFYQLMAQYDEIPKKRFISRNVRGYIWKKQKTVILI